MWREWVYTCSISLTSDSSDDTPRMPFEDTLYKCEFADDVALLATTCAAAGTAIQAYYSEAEKFGLTVNVSKTNFLVVGHEGQDLEMLPMTVNGGSIECVKEFQYLGSIIAADSRIDAEVDKHLANALKAFGALQKAVFTNINLSLTTKRQVYQACVLSVLQYGGECWILLKKHLKRLNAFHHRCIHTVLGITNMRQWDEWITSRMTREQWGDQEIITVKLMKRRLEWLGHLARMPDHLIPQKTLFS